MSAYKSDFLNVLADRGFIHQVSEPEALDALARKSTITGYIGFDCTAPSLHIGSLLPIMLLYWLQQTGHRPIALMGGGTTRVGDPSGKDESRRLLTDEAINENLKGIRAIFAKFLKFEDADGFWATPSWPTMPTGSTRSITSTSCATSAAIFPSTACWPSIRSSCGSSGSRNCRFSNSTT